METLTIRKKIHFKLGRNNRNQIIQGTPEPVIKKLFYYWFGGSLDNLIAIISTKFKMYFFANR